MPVKTETGELFIKGLLRWNKKNDRKMPWKGETDPYKIWLSEVILQQTRVGQGLKYYENFVNVFPDVHSLANAPEEKVFKLWEGLGYYSRCRHLIATAKYISKELNGVFPKNYDDILNLKGVGSYTAAAIASFAYNQPYAVLDGNVFRVLSRIFNKDTPIDSSKGKKEFPFIAQSLLPAHKAAEYNQAIMDFGALICKPSPVCSLCFFNKECKARLLGKQDVLPVKQKKIRTKERWFNYLFIRHLDQVLLHQRTVKDIWQQLHQFPLIESAGTMPVKKIIGQFEEQHGFFEHTTGNIFQTSQKLSHQLIHFSFIEIELTNKREFNSFFWAQTTELERFAFPKTLQQFISGHLV